MKNAVLCVPMALGSVCLGGITEIIDQRTANIDIVQLWGQEDTNEGVVYNSNGLSEQFDGLLQLAADDPVSGYVDTRVEFVSNISMAGFSSSSTAYAQTEAPEGGFNFGNVAFANRVTFTLDSTTSFSIVADLWAAGPDDAAMISFERVLGMDTIAVYDAIVMNDAQQIDDVLTLEAGVYRFAAINWASVDSFGRLSDTAQSSLTVDVGVVPGPSALICLGAGLFGVRRRR